MKKITLFLGFLLISVGVFAQTTWTADPYHSKLGFTVTHLVIADVPGHFDKYDVNITSSKEDFSDAVIELTVYTNSIIMRVESRDAHLRCAYFFTVEQFPTIKFKSNSIKIICENKYTLSGNLTLTGFT